MVNTGELEPQMRSHRWLILAILVPVLWGVWGALIEIPERHIHPPFPSTLGYVVWSLTMIPCSLLALGNAHWRLDWDRKSALYGLAVGFSGCVGQLLLFKALMDSPAYIVFPIICLSPVVTIILSLIILKERAHSLAVTGIVLSLVAMFFLSLQKSDGGPVRGHMWLVGAMMVFLLWGIQAYFMKSSASSITSESLFLYMAATAVLVAPFALLLTDFSAPINWGLRGPFLTAIIQVLNSIGALLLIYAIRAGKAIIVVPMINGLFPVITIVLSLLIYRRIPSRYNSLGMLLALIAICLMAYGEVVRQASSST
jgi:drug/metabolite transporter (DMT)-like permease